MLMNWSTDLNDSSLFRCTQCSVTIWHVTVLQTIITSYYCVIENDCPFINTQKLLLLRNRELVVAAAQHNAPTRDGDVILVLTLTQSPSVIIDEMASNKQPIVFRIKTQQGEDMDWTMSSPNTTFADVMVSILPLREVRPKVFGSLTSIIVILIVTLGSIVEIHSSAWIKSVRACPKKVLHSS